MNISMPLIFSKILSIGVSSELSHVKNQRIKNTNIASVLSFCIGMLSTSFTIHIVPAPYIYMPLGACFLYLISLVLNYLRYQELASANIGLVTNLLFFWLANAYGKESNAYMLFIIAEMATIFNFHVKAKNIFFWSFILPLTLVLISFWGNCAWFLIPTFTVEQRTALSPIMFFVTMIGSAVVIWTYRFQLDAQIKKNEESSTILAEKYGELEKNHKALTKANQELDQFVYSVSHDLRAPITSVMGLLDLCEQDTSNVAKYLVLQRKSIKKLDNFINEILNYSRNEHFEVNPVEKSNFEEGIKDLFLGKCELEHAENISLNLKVEGETSFFIDEFRWQLIVNNLFSNAIRYRKLTNEPSYVDCHLIIAEKELKLTISDNGIGIPAAHQNKIFNMFYRANVRSTGAGLGLYILKEALAKLKGEVYFNSEENIGSVFSVTIPNMKNRISA